MSESSNINSNAYWDRRFSDDWEAHEGPRQSRFFAQLAVDNLPAWLFDKIRLQELSVVDWGCAQGDGTDLLASYIGAQNLVGVDFSTVAVEQAAMRYPAIRFLSENWLLRESNKYFDSYDIVYSSNTLEHFHQPYKVLESLGVRAKKAIILALPYRELDRIDEHFFSFLSDNIPFELGNGFRLVWSRVVDCKDLPNTLWGGDQVFLVYAEMAWISSLKLTLKDCEILKSDEASKAASLNEEVVARDSQIATLNEEIVARDSQIASLNEEIVARDSQIASLNEEIVAHDCQSADFKQDVALLRTQLKGLLDSRSWRMTRSLRVIKLLYCALHNESVRYHFFKSLYWKLPTFLRMHLSELRYQYVAHHYRVRTDSLPTGDGVGRALSSPEQSQDWIFAVRYARKIVIIPCGFEFDELVNQRPINAAKYFAQQGYVVLFIAWQWSRGDIMTKKPGQVYQDIYQVPLFDFIDYKNHLPVKQTDAMYFLTLPAPILVDLVPTLRSKGYSIIYDIMDEWEAFHESGQAPWFDRDVELSMVLQSDVVSAVTPALVSKFSGIRTDIQLIGNGYTPEVLGTESRGIAGSSEGGIRTIGYFGHLTDAWFDWSLIFLLADNHPEIQFDLIGYGEPEWVRDRAMESKNINLIGKVQPKNLHDYVRRWSFGVIPFLEGDLARAVDPIKIYEYLYFGLPTFVTGIEHLKLYPNVFFSSRADASSIFNEIISNPSIDDLAVDYFLEETTWSARFSSLQSYISQKKTLGDMYVP